MPTNALCLRAGSDDLIRDLYLFVSQTRFNSGILRASTSPLDPFLVFVSGMRVITHPRDRKGGGLIVMILDFGRETSFACPFHIVFSHGSFMEKFNVCWCSVWGMSARCLRGHS